MAALVMATVMVMVMEMEMVMVMSNLRPQAKDVF